MKRPMHPNSLANLSAHKWKPGESGNTGGRKKRLVMTEEYENVLSEPMRKTKFGRDTIKEFGLERNCTWSRAIALGQAKEALKHPQSAKEMREPTDGRALPRLRIEEPPETTAIDQYTEDELRAEVAKILARVIARSQEPPQLPPADPLAN